MSRLLLVDDNPSIHRIAESLLAPTDVELVCVDSAAEALDRIARGERFDVALVDTAMPGMDGWTLLSRLRAMEETARMPIALMAGVLDPVDPAKLAKAPIQGFLKKPIELRELGDRVKALLVTPVPVGPSPFSTVPATPAQDLIKRAEAALPEFRPEPVPVPVVEEPAVDQPAGLTDLDLELPEHGDLPEHDDLPEHADLPLHADLPVHEEDLLVLTAEDLWPEELAPTTPAVPVLPDVHLELEELDLESLQDLTGEPLPEVAPVAEALPEPAPIPEPAPAPVHALAVEEDHLVTLSGLEDLETLPSDFDFPPSHEAPETALPEPAPHEPVAHAPVVHEPAAHEPVAHELAEPDHSLDHLPAAASLLGIAGVAAAAGLALHGASHEAAHEVHEPTPIHQEPDVLPVIPEPAQAPAAGGQVPAVPGHPAPAPAEPMTTEQARAVVQALLADPVLVDALVKAVVARMGDQVLREIAWEVMPDLAGRLQR